MQEVFQLAQDQLTSEEELCGVCYCVIYFWLLQHTPYDKDEMSVTWNFTSVLYTSDLYLFVQICDNGF
jgi:hypothetical protein